MIKYFATEFQVRRQLGISVRIEMERAHSRGMVATMLSSDGGTNGVVIFMNDFKVGHSDYHIGESIPATGLTVTPATTSIAVGATRQLTASVVSTDATDKSRHNEHHPTLQLRR